jgi:sugar lactone lactonase YvrE
MINNSTIHCGNINQHLGKIFMKMPKRLPMLLVPLLLLLIIGGEMFVSATLHPAKAAPAQTMSIRQTAYHVPNGTDIWGTTMDSQGNVWVALPGCDPDPTCSGGTPPGKIASFNPSTGKWVQTHKLPSGYSQPLFVKFDQQGRIWFPLPMSNSIAMFDPATKKFQQWTVPTPDSGPWDLTIDAQGNIWFTEHFGAQIGRFNPSNDTFQEYATPSTNSQPYGITLDASGNVWYTENNSAVARIAEYTTQGQMLEYKIRNSQDASLTPHLITVDPNGNIWWTEGFVGELGELNISQAQPGTTNGVTEYPYNRLCQSCGMHTSGIGVDSNGLIWFDDSLQGLYGSFPDRGTGKFHLWNAPGKNNPHPHDGLMVDSQNRIWFDEEFADKLIKVIYTK